MAKVYAQGATGPVVRTLQTELNAKNAAGLEITGKFDKETFEAFKAYQRRQGLKATGEFTKDDRIWKLLSPDEPEEAEFEVVSESLEEAKKAPFEVVPQPAAGPKAPPTIPSNKTVKKG